MPIDVLDPDLEPVPEIAKRVLPAKPSPATLWRWDHEGVLAPDGSRVRLETVKIGRRVYTTEASLRRFLTRLQDRPAPKQPAAAATDPDRHARTDDALREAGLLDAPAKRRRKRQPAAG